MPIDEGIINLMLVRLCAALAVTIAIAGCSTGLPVAISHDSHMPGSIPAEGRPAANSRVTTASWYGPGFNGHRTSTGESFDPHGFTAASQALPLGTYARVTNLDNGQSVVVRVNDRGPYVRGRGIDLSQAAADRLSFRREGVARVEVTRLDTTASAIEPPPERWRGTVRVRRHYHSRHYHRRHGLGLVRNPFATWLLEMTR
jgi:rare lipoprotein A (peptidoglycan hydrolase)